MRMFITLTPGGGGAGGGGEMTRDGSETRLTKKGSDGESAFFVCARIMFMKNLCENNNNNKNNNITNFYCI